MVGLDVNVRTPVVAYWSSHLTYPRTSAVLTEASILDGTVAELFTPFKPMHLLVPSESMNKCFVASW